ncbi:MAG: hypothetical protein JNL88_11585 [Bacteroidia bacterium]|nr:hypothetical protein [Bacteroidia bacterium]
MKDRKGKTKNLRILLAVILLFVALNALVAGALLIMDPTGSLLGMKTDLLKNGPLRDFTVPGHVLFHLFGLMNVLAFFLLLKNCSGARSLVMLQGVLLGIWILVQMWILEQINFLQLFMLLLGIVLFALARRLERE